MAKAIPIETFKLSQLRLDQKNYRLGEVGTQRDAILEMIRDQKQKLVSLARDIMEVGTSPGEPIWVTKDSRSPGMYLVLEGNRRVTALKLMENPALADGTIVEKHFANLGKLYQKKPIRDLEAKVFPNREDAQQWIRRRHMTAASGIGLQRWAPEAKGRADRAHGLKTPRFLAVIELLAENSEAWNTIYEALDDKWTTVDRVLNTKAMAETLGVSTDLRKGVVRFESGNTSAGKALLWRILTKIASPDFKFADVESVTDRENFIAQFADGAVKSKKKAKAPTKPVALPRTPPRPPTPTIVIPPQSRASDANRPTLAPRTGPRTFRVVGARLYSLYEECKGIKLAKNRNAAALLLRVFVELSTEAVLAKRNAAIPRKFQDRNKTKWSDIGIPLDVKIAEACNYFDPRKTAKEFQQARIALDPSAASTVFSTPTLHGYFHNLSLIPDPAALRGAWDAWEPYLRVIHDDLRKP